MHYPLNIRILYLNNMNSESNINEKQLARKIHVELPVRRYLFICFIFQKKKKGQTGVEVDSEK